MKRRRVIGQEPAETYQDDPSIVRRRQGIIGVMYNLENRTASTGRIPCPVFCFVVACEANYFLYLLEDHYVGFYFCSRRAGQQFEKY